MDSNEAALNPWTSIWTKPRATIQHIVNTDPRRGVLLLAAIYGFSQFIASPGGLGDRLAWPILIIAAAIVGPIMGIIGLYIGSALIRRTGNWLGGFGSPQKIRAAMAWSNVPVVWSLALWIPALALFGQELFTTRKPIAAADPQLAMAMLGFWVIQLAVWIWSIVAFLKCLGQVQGFSAWRALGNVVLSVLILVPIVLLSALILAPVMVVLVR